MELLGGSCWLAVSDHHLDFQKEKSLAADPSSIPSTSWPGALSDLFT